MSHADHGEESLRRQGNDASLVQNELCLAQRRGGAENNATVFCFTPASQRLCANRLGCVSVAKIRAKRSQLGASSACRSVLSVSPWWRGFSEAKRQ